MPPHLRPPHAIFTVFLTQKRVSATAGTGGGQAGEAGEEEEGVLTSKFNFVDLAGSERLKLGTAWLVK